MLFKRPILQAIARGEITLAFRRWRRPSVVAGSRLHTEAGVLEIRSIEEVTPESVTESDAREAGFGHRAALLASLPDLPGATLYRIRLVLAGPDPRIALREECTLTADGHAALSRSLDRLDRSSRIGPWTRRVLSALADHPEESAGSLATRLDVEKEWLKRNVRKLKNLGLTESLQPGYRLSPRGRAYLERKSP